MSKKIKFVMSLENEETKTEVEEVFSLEELGLEDNDNEDYLWYYVMWAIATI